MTKKKLFLILIVITIISIPTFHVYKVWRINSIYGSTLYSRETRENQSAWGIPQEVGPIFNCGNNKFLYSREDIYKYLKNKDNIDYLLNLCPEDMDNLQEFPNAEIFQLVGSYSYEKKTIETSDASQEEKQLKLSELEEKYNYDYSKLSVNKKLEKISLTDVGLKEVPFINVNPDLRNVLWFHLQDTDVLRGLEKYQGVNFGSMRIHFSGNKITKSTLEFLNSDPIADRISVWNSGEVDINSLEVVEDDYKE